MNPSILEDCPVCNNFQPRPDEIIERDGILQVYRGWVFCSAYGIRHIRPYAAGEPRFYTVKLNQVRNQASNGCPGCAMLYQGSLHYLESWPEPLRDEDQITIAVGSALGQAIECWLRATDSKLPTTVQDWHFQILAHDDHRNPWKTMAKISSSPRYVLTDEHRDWYLSWVQECLENHPKCQRSSAMPTRLIDLGDDDKGTMCLRDDIDQITPYIALSHSWQFSEARKSMTLKENYESRKRFLPQQGLSQTFHDAIKVARWLGVRYLWIDTFCIIQDDPDDWAQQASRMGDIFEGAYITIAAHSGLDSSPTDGCFLERKAIQEVNLADDNGDQFLAFIRRGEILHHDLNNGPSLMRRGWCVQERLLAPRVLHFRPDEVSFECFTLKHCECEEMSLKIVDKRGMSRREKDIADFFHMSGRGQELNWDQCWDAWYEFVEIYSASHLTVPTDRLVALSSLVQRMPQQIFGDYLAGVWSKNLIEQLVWRTMPGWKYFRYQEYIAPSFSWASIHGGPIFSRHRRIGKGTIQKARLLDAATVPKTHDAMGPVREGFIYMRLRICEAKAILTCGQMEQIDLLYHDKDERPGGSASIDSQDDLEELEGQRVCLGEMLREREHAIFLVMRKVAGRGRAFQRVGVGRCYLGSHRDPFHQVPEQEIKLV